MIVYKVKVRGTYKTTEKKLKPFDYDLIVPTPCPGKAEYFANRLVVAKLKDAALIDFEYIQKIYVTTKTAIEYKVAYPKGGIIGKLINNLTEYELQELAVMHNLKKVPYFQKDSIEEITKRALIEYVKKTRPEIGAEKIEGDFSAIHVSALPMVKIKASVVEKAVVAEEEQSAVDMFTDEIEDSFDEPVVDDQVDYAEVDDVSDIVTSGMNKEELIDALKGLGISNIHPRCGIVKLQAKYDAALASM